MCHSSLFVPTKMRCAEVSRTFPRYQYPVLESTMGWRDLVSRSRFEPRLAAPAALFSAPAAFPLSVSCVKFPTIPHLTFLLYLACVKSRTSPRLSFLRQTPHPSCTSPRSVPFVISRNPQHLDLCFTKHSAAKSRCLSPAGTRKTIHQGTLRAPTTLQETSLLAVC